MFLGYTLSWAYIIGKEEFFYSIAVKLDESWILKQRPPFRCVKSELKFQI